MLPTTSGVKNIEGVFFSKSDANIAKVVTV